jgi:tetratricopeptide (TPR) repeat protein
MRHGCACRLEEALEDFSAAIRADPSCAVSYHSRASLLQTANSLQEALQDFDAAVRLAPGSPSFYRCVRRWHGWLVGWHWWCDLICSGPWVGPCFAAHHKCLGGPSTPPTTAHDQRAV